MSDTKNQRIRKQLARLARAQERIEARLDAVEARLGAGGGAAVEAPGAQELIRFLDLFRAGEALGEASLGLWIEACQAPCLKGGLRTIQGREGLHARLLAERIKELGGSPTAEVPEAVYDATMRSAASREKSDGEKLAEFMARFPDIDAALAPIHAMADRLDCDQETQSLLRSIAQDERATLELVAEACALLHS